MRCNDSAGHMSDFLDIPQGVRARLVQLRRSVRTNDATETRGFGAVGLASPSSSHDDIFIRRRRTRVDRRWVVGKGAVTGSSR